MRAPLLLFAGGIFSFGASQSQKRRSGLDSAVQQERWQREAQKLKCAQPGNLRCRYLYSMGVRQAIWRERLWAEPDIRIVSAGVPDYLQAVPHARFCLHTEGNSWGTRLIDYMAMECIPIIVNDGMVQVFENLLPYADFAFHLSKRQIPELLSFLRNVSNGTRAAMYPPLRRHKRAFIWFRPEGLAYEYTLASLGERIASLRLGEQRGERPTVSPQPIHVYDDAVTRRGRLTPVHPQTTKNLDNRVMPAAIATHRSQEAANTPNSMLQAIDLLNDLQPAAQQLSWALGNHTASGARKHKRLVSSLRSRVKRLKRQQEKVTARSPLTSNIAFFCLGGILGSVLTWRLVWCGYTRYD